MTKQREYKKEKFKVYGYGQVYSTYLFGEFQGYCFKERKYQLKRENGVNKEKFVGWGYTFFHKQSDMTWDEWKEFNKKS